LEFEFRKTVRNFTLFASCKLGGDIFTISSITTEQKWETVEKKRKKRFLEFEFRKAVKNFTSFTSRKPKVEKFLQFLPSKMNRNGKQLKKGGKRGFWILNFEKPLKILIQFS
jgi:hypothetical protein